jgi:hypothetical protein
MATTLVERLKLFNRKERYWLIRNALGEGRAEIPLSNGFRRRLTESIGIEIPVTAWWAIDYHIDWLFGALRLDRKPDANDGDVWENPEDGETDERRRLIRGTQEDFDLIVAFDRTIILIEAKGVTGWGGAQLQSKKQRLAHWSEYSDQLNAERDLSSDAPRIFVVLTSPRNPTDGVANEWPKCVQNQMHYWLEMDFAGAPKEFRVVERCTETSNGKVKSSSEGRHWHLKSVKKPKSVTNR